MKQIIRMIVFVIVLGSLLTVILLVADHYTAPVIEANQRIAIRENVLQALGIDAGSDEVDAVFDRSVEVREVAGTTLYVAADGTRAIAYEGSGLWGPISGILSVSPDGREIKSVTIIHQEETPGLGGRIAEPAFLAGFSGRPIDTPLVVTAPGKASKPNEIDAITGATLSSNAFVALLNEHVAHAISLLQGGGQ